MKRLGCWLKSAGTAALALALFFGALYAYGRYVNSSKRLVQTHGDTASLALVDQTALTALLNEADRTHSDAIVVLKDGQLVGAWHTNGEERRFGSKSVTKSIMSLIVGRAYTMGYIESLDEPMSTYISEWSNPPYNNITLRQVLGHSSGIGRALGYEYMWRSDTVAFGVNSPVLEEPGTIHQYSNRTSNLLPVVIEQATGQPADEFARDHLLHPMGITDFNFSHDRAGNVYGSTGFRVTPMGNAKLGQLALDRGWYDGQSLIDEAWFDVSFSPSTAVNPSFGLSWWLDNDLTFVIDEAHLAYLENERGASDELLQKLKTLTGTYESGADLEAGLFNVLGDDAFAILEDEIGVTNLVSRKIPKELRSFNANGDFGQFIVGIPDSNLVAVRMYEDTWSGMLVALSDGEQTGFRNFVRYVSDLAE